MQQFDYSDPFAFEQARAQASLQQAQQNKQYKAPTGAGMVGRVYVGNSPLQGMAELLRNYQAGKQEEAAMQKLKGIGEQRQSALVEGLRKFNETYQGTPEKRTEVPQQVIVAGDGENDGEMSQGHVTQVTPAIKANPFAAISGLAGAQHPMLAQAGVKMMAEYPQQQAEAAAKAATIARQEKADAERERHNRVVEENTVKAIAGRGVEKLKTLPPAVNSAFLGNDQSLNTLNSTIDLLEKNPDATGFKGYLPNAILNRVDPEGTTARAGVADIGSLKIHDRSGAAVSASESPRLMPFIPLATDDNATVLKKLKRFRDEVAREQSGLAEIYSQDQGYRPNPIANRTPKPEVTKPAAASVVSTGMYNGRKVNKLSDGSIVYAD